MCPVRDPQSSAKLPRPLNPYVKLRLGGKSMRTNTITSNKNPVWGGKDDNCRFRFDAPDPNAIFYVTVGDWKIGANVWVARLAIPLASIEVSPSDAEDGEIQEFSLRCRLSRFTKHIEKEGVGDAKLKLRIKYEHPERCWIVKVSPRVGWSRGARVRGSG